MNHFIKCARNHINNKHKSNNLPYILVQIQRFISRNIAIKDISHNTDDGRVNSNFDEQKIISLITSNELFRPYVIVPNKRMWYDILVKDLVYGLCPVNIKTTNLNTADNVGNLSLCVQAYTDYTMDYNKFYTNNSMYKILLNKLKNAEINKNQHKDYFFLVVNKKDPTDVIINSVLGLHKLTKNLNNLPFQVNWKYNRIYEFDNINKKITQFLSCFQDCQSWTEIFLTEIRKIHI